VSLLRRNPGVFARLRWFATNILRADGAANITDARHRIAFSIDAILAVRVIN
jgi:hypothetical protein